MDDTKLLLLLLDDDTIDTTPDDDDDEKYNDHHYHLPTKRLKEGSKSRDKDCNRGVPEVVVGLGTTGLNNNDDHDDDDGEMLKNNKDDEDWAHEIVKSSLLPHNRWQFNNRSSNT